MQIGRPFGGMSFSKNVISPEGWQKNPPNYESPEGLDLIGYTMVLPISTYKFDAETTIDHLNTTCLEGFLN